MRSTQRRRSVWRDRRGGVGVFVACVMPVLAGFAAFAVDWGTVQLDARRLQGVADAAALAAASDPARGDAAASALVAASWSAAAVVRTVPGRYRADTAVPAAERFVPDPHGDAAQVQVSTVSPTFFAKVFGVQSVRIVKRAIAQRRAAASFSVGSRLVGLEGGVLNTLLSALTGRTVTLGVLDHRALIASNVDLFQVLDRLKVRADLSVNDYGDLLASEVRVVDLFGALADVLETAGQASAAGAVSRVAGASGGQVIRLNALIDAGPLARQAGGGTGVARVPVLPFMTTVLQTGGGTRRLSLDLGGSLPGVASTRLSVAFGERAQSSPWLAVTEGGITVVRTAQARIYARMRLAPTLLPGLSSLVTVDLPLFVEAAGAEARLRHIDCAARPRSVTLEGRVLPLEAAIGQVDETKLADFSHAMAPSPARLIDTLLVDMIGSSRISLGAAEPWQVGEFDQPMIDAARSRTIRGSNPVEGVAASLVAHAALSVNLIGISIPADPLLRGVGTLLTGVAPAIDGIVTAVTGAVGLGIGEADLRVDGLRCGTAILVG